MSENEIRDLLGEGIGAEPPIVGGPAAVFAAARTRAVRGRLVTGALSTVAVLGIAAGAVAFSGGSGGPGEQSAIGGGGGGGGQCAAGDAPSPVRGSGSEQPSSVTESASPGGAVSTGSPGPATSSPLAPGKVLLDPQTALLLLKQALPCGTASGFQGQVTQNTTAPTSGREVGGSMALTDRFGVGTVAVSVQQNGEWRRALMSCSTRPKDASCRAETLANGTVVLADEFPLGHGETDRVVEVLRRDGLHITVMAENVYTPWNQQHSDKATRPTPPLTMDELRAVALSAPWSLTVAQDLAAQAKQQIAPYADTSHPAAVKVTGTKS
jgi:hypothetical protein